MRPPRAGGVGDDARETPSSRARVAVVSNPFSDGNKVHRGRVRRFCTTRPELAHFEIHEHGDLDAVLQRIVESNYRVLAINGGDGTVQGVLTRLFGEDGPGPGVPPIAVLPSGRTNLIAKDLGATGDPIAALEHLIDLTERGIGKHLVQRRLISLDTGDGSAPTMGMFFAAGALADTLLYCRHKIYPLRWPNWLAHLITVMAGLISVLTNSTSRFLPPMPRQARIRIGGHDLNGRFQVLMVSTLQALVLTGKIAPPKDGRLGLVAMERRRLTVLRSVISAFFGKVGYKPIPGLHFVAGEDIRFDEALSDAIMDGESFAAAPGRSISLKPGANVRFVDLGRGVRAMARAPEDSSRAGSGALQLARPAPLWNQPSRP